MILILRRAQHEDFRGGLTLSQSKGAGMSAPLVIPGEQRAVARCEGRGTRWFDHARSFHLGSLPLASLSQCSAGNDRRAS